ncbi:MAG TPA: NAD(P)/FAD-dependent oxidoreductase [Candidatus Baltobacteraceae bacterium]|nr:NAD(P)/FAD-dependent oxidoreductase [Candidatus Baltobacteraceae bacterium]
MFDVVIAGAGPAGSAAALHLRREGLSVALVDPAEFPRAKVCGEYLSAATVRELHAIGVGRALAPQAHPIEKLRIRTGKAEAMLPFARNAWSLPRCVLDNALRDAAVTAGAVPVRARVESVEHGAARCVVLARNASGEGSLLSARVAIGADGAHSAVARSCGLTLESGRRERFALGGHYRYASPHADAVQMFVGDGSYFALNPLQADLVNVMLVVPKRELSRHRDDVESYMRERISALTDGAIAYDAGDFEGKRLSTGPLAHRVRRFTSPGVLLAGDAAHFVDPFTGQGVYLALHAARLAARAATAHLRRGVSQAEAWRRYERDLQREIHRRERYAKLASLVVKAPLLAPVARAFTPLLNAVSA